MPPRERRWRSELAKFAAEMPWLRGSLVERRRVCGKPGCRCVQGHTHRGLYLMASKDGRTRQLYVPPELESTVRQWIANHQQLKQRIEQLSDLHWERVRQRRP
jgi:hypothetical protein